MSLKKLRLCKRIIQDITMTFFKKTLFWTLKLCWKISLKNAGISVLVLLKWIVCRFIHCTFWSHSLLFASVLNNITITLKMSLKNHIFSVHLQENADFIKFLFASRLQKVCNLIQIRLSYIHAMFHEPSSSGSNFR